tara:strand:- start:155 stop:658 length:504 start_codon:yes stop_codon:yes gene_type:complete
MIYVGIGSNLSSSFGDRFKNIELALSFLKENKIKLIKKSSFYETFSYPDKSKPKFINIVASIESTLPALDLMTVLISIEEKLERKRFKKNDPRTCDIDIIDYKREIMSYKRDNFELILPHKSMIERNFVLHPLKEICPDWIHPITKKNIDVLIKNLKTPNNEITKLP